MTVSTTKTYDVVAEPEEVAGGRQKSRSQSRQYLASFIVNILTFVAGSTYGWMAPMLPVLQSEDSPVGIPPISDHDASLLASITSMSRLLTVPVYGYTVQRLGHKITGYLIAVPLIISWAMLLSASSMSMLFWSRFITGLAFGGIPLVVPSYTIDIAEDNIKGRLGVLFGLSMSIGCTFSYAMGSYTSFTMFHMSNLLVPILFICVFFWMPESPLFLMTQGKTAAAKKALRWLRNGEDCASELERTQKRAQDVIKQRTQKISLKIIFEKSTWRALLICMGLIINQQFCGPAPITSYTLTIFQKSGSTIPASIATIVIGVLQTISSLLSTMVIEKCGRRVLLITSNIVMAVCLIVLGVYLYLRGLGWDLELVGWLPVACLSIYILGLGLAVGPLPFTIVTEMVSPKARNIVQGICMALSSLTTFTAIISFMPLVRLVGQHCCFWLYATVSVVSAACIYFLMPETKNRSIEDVVKQLKRDDYIHSVLQGRARTPEEGMLQCSG